MRITLDEPSTGEYDLHEEVDERIPEQDFHQWRAPHGAVLDLKDAFVHC